MSILRNFTHGLWDRVQKGARRLLGRGAASGSDGTAGKEPSIRNRSVDRAFSRLPVGVADPRRNARPDHAAEATAQLYSVVINRLTEQYGPRSEALVPALFALAEFEAGRGHTEAARNAAAAARSIVLAQWGRKHPLWPLVEARHNAIVAKGPDQPGKR